MVAQSAQSVEHPSKGPGSVQLADEGLNPGHGSG